MSAPGPCSGRRINRDQEITAVVVELSNGGPEELGASVSDTLLRYRVSRMLCPGIVVGVEGGRRLSEGDVLVSCGLWDVPVGP